jgi:hypothetical protein
MKRKSPLGLPKLFNRVVQAAFRPGKYITITCRMCNDSAAAQTLKAARMFGWTRVSRIKGKRYRGFCISCSSGHTQRAPQAASL